MSSRSLSDALNLFSFKSNSLLGSLKYSSFYQSLTSLEKTKLWSRFYIDEEDASSDVLDILSNDQKIITYTRSDQKRRTVLLKRNKNTEFGFTVQTYIIKRSKDEFPMKISYIDYVHFEGPAADAGIRPGDVIVSINGFVVTEMPHNELIALISSCQEMRMILVFENIRERIQLVARSIRLKKLLNDKLYQLNQIGIEEQNILNRAYARATTLKECVALNDSADTYGPSLFSRTNAEDRAGKFTEGGAAEKCDDKRETQKVSEAASTLQDNTGNFECLNNSLKVDASSSTVNSYFEEDSFAEITRL